MATPSLGPVTAAHVGTRSVGSTPPSQVSAADARLAQLSGLLLQPIYQPAPARSPGPHPMFRYGTARSRPKRPSGARAAAGAGWGWSRTRVSSRANARTRPTRTRRVGLIADRAGGVGLGPGLPACLLPRRLGDFRR